MLDFNKVDQFSDELVERFRVFFVLDSLAEFVHSFPFVRSHRSASKEQQDCDQNYVIGIAASVLLTRLLERFLFQVKTNDPVTFMVVEAVNDGAFNNADEQFRGHKSSRHIANGEHLQSIRGDSELRSAAPVATVTESPAQ